MPPKQRQQRSTSASPPRQGRPNSPGGPSASALEAAVMTATRSTELKLSLPGLHIPRLDLSVDTIDDFDAWRATLEAYFDAVNIQHDETDGETLSLKKMAGRRACMLNAFTSATFRKYKNLPLTDQEFRDPETVMNAIREHVLGQVNIIVERNRFWKRQQSEGESFNDYVMQLRDLMRTCKFCEHSEDLLRDKIVLGVRNPETVKRLLAQPDLSLADALTICRSEEASESQRNEICTGAHVSAVRKQRGRTPVRSNSRNPGAGNCTACGKGRHQRSDCPAKDKKCFHCGRIGHFGSVCRSNRTGGQNDKKRQPRVSTLIATLEPATPMVTVNINGKQLEMMPDTGSNMDAIREVDCKMLGIPIPKPRHNAIMPKSASGQFIKSNGSFCATITLNKRYAATRIHVLKDLVAPVLSWQSCKKLKIVPDDFPNQISAIALNGSGRRITEQDLIQEFPRVFDGKIRPMSGEKFQIVLKKEAIPFSVKTPRRLALPLHEKLKKELDALEEQRIICKVTDPTQWCAPIVVAPKKNSDQIRLCIDFRELNKYVMRPRYQSPTPLEVVASTNVSKAKWFTVVDALKGYHQVPLHETSMPLTTFITPFGRYMFRMAPFGISSISEYYNQRLDDVLQDLKDTRHIVDDCIIASMDYEGHIQAVREFIKRCDEACISLNKQKFVFAREKVKFAGFVLSQNCYEIDPEMTIAIAHFPEPSNITELRAFMGLVNQIGPFTNEIAECTSILRPLLSTKNSFIWDQEQQKAFEKARSQLSKVPSLAYYDHTKPTALHTDASRLRGLGFVLKQQQQDGTWKMIQAGSRFLADAETRYAMIELELLAIVWATQKCRLFLEGLPSFQIMTDHKPLIPILNSYQLDQIENPRLQRLRAKLNRYNYDAKWVRGKDNTDADALSRAPVANATQEDQIDENQALNSVNLLIMSLEEAESDLNMKKIQDEVQQDAEMQELIRVIENGFPNEKGNLPENLRPYWHVRHNLAVNGGIILNGCRCVIPKQLRQETLKTLHASHQGATKTKARARMIMFWPGMERHIDDVIKQCRACQEAKPSQVREPMMRRRMPERCFQEVHADFCEHRGRQFLVVVDGYSGWINVWNFGQHAPVHKLINACRELFCQTAVPEAFWSDSGPQFKASAFVNFLKRWGVESKFSSPYHHQSNGRAEAAVKSAKKIIRGAWDDRINDIDKDQMAEGILIYRNTPMYDGRVPSIMLYGHPARDSLPAHRSSFNPEWHTTIQQMEQKAIEAHDTVAQRFDKSKRHLQGIRIGSNVVLQDPTTKLWQRRGVVVEVGKHRDYLIKLASGRILRRNRIYIRPILPWNGGDLQLPKSSLADHGGARADNRIPQGQQSERPRISMRSTKSIPPKRFEYCRLGQPRVHFT